MPHSFLSFLVLLYLLFTAQTHAQSLSILNDGGATPYAYFGCYNETTQLNNTGGVRALAGGSQQSSTVMTVKTCLDFCKKSQYAGLEYGQECWCSPYLSSVSKKVPDVNCNMACTGNSSQSCGSLLVLSIYQVAATNAAVSLYQSPVAVAGLVVLIPVVLVAGGLWN